MDELTRPEEEAIREFLQQCLSEGLFGFSIDGRQYLLESEDDIETITLAIKKATPPVIRYRVQQARSFLNRKRTVNLNRELAMA